MKKLPKDININISCDRHPAIYADYYCTKHKTLICHKCAILEHHDHVTDLNDINRDDLVQFSTKAIHII